MLYKSFRAFYLCTIIKVQNDLSTIKVLKRSSVPLYEIFFPQVPLPSVLPVTAGKASRKDYFTLGLSHAPGTGPATPCAPSSLASRMCKTQGPRPPLASPARVTQGPRRPVLASARPAVARDAGATTSAHLAHARDAGAATPALASVRPALTRDAGALRPLPPLARDAGPRAAASHPL
ncbi:hypothetical protein BDA96_01G054600 [Sorghum bicolor]|jgi:hypothetical protein|uniref:Uncharacterized protein n=1 Tax=Sorghum bicolor TaxID=4558 RepID=A0A921UXL7_SORBI|nr:hypothetical protein BDA96_01G054600 [Sorghum bicolor]